MKTQKKVETSNKSLKSKIVNNERKSSSNKFLSRKRKEKKSKEEDLTEITNKSTNKKGLVFDFESSIVDKFSSDHIVKNQSSIKNSWNYSKIIANEKKFKDERHENNKITLKEEATIEDIDSNNSINDEDEKYLEDKFENDLFEKDCSFTNFNLSKLLLRACSDLNFFHPTKVQAKVIPLILQGEDVLVNAETGSGKTACYLLPTIQKILTKKNTKVLLLVPTRDLAIQCEQMLQNLLKYFDSISYCSIIGGFSIQNQIGQLQKKPDIIIATPGRLIDMLYNHKSFELDYINVLILDEADKLLELGFKDAILEILYKMGSIGSDELDLKKNDKAKHNKLNDKKNNLQTLLFSATLNTKVIDLGNAVLSNPVKLKLAHSNVLNNLKQSVVRMRFKEKVNLQEEETTKSVKIQNKDNSKKHKKKAFSSEEEFLQRMSYLINILKDKKKQRSIIFFNTKQDCHKAKIILDDLNIKAEEVHSDIHQTQRLQALEDFQQQKTHFLLATDVLGRGIDIEKIKCVINFQMPLQQERYTHRIGRTARKGNLGHAITICNEDDRHMFKKLLKEQSFKLLPLKIDNDSVKKVLKDLKLKKEEYKENYEADITEKDILLAEVKAEKSMNENRYRDDIMNKPKKGWYLNKKQKETLQNKAKKEFELN